MKYNQIDKQYFDRVPSFWLRWGTMLVLGCTLLLCLIAHWISYPDIVSGRVEVMGSGPVVHLSAQTSGRIQKFHYGQGIMVEKGQILLEIENPARTDDVERLRAMLDTTGEILNATSPIADSMELHLGDIQPYFLRFRDLVFQKRLWDSLLPAKTYDSLSRDRSQELAKWIEGSKDLLQELDREITLGQKERERFRILKEKGVVSPSEYETQVRAQIDREQERSRLRQRISETKLMVSSQEDLRQQQGLDLAMEMGRLTDRIQNALMELLKAIDDHERQYIIRAPISGRINWLIPEIPFHGIARGEPVVAILPQESQGPTGVMEVTALNKGKIKQGQSVLVQLDNYPRAEYGSLPGSVSAINQVPHPEKKTYTVTLVFESMVTSYRRELPIEAVHLGRGHIVTMEMNLWQRLFRGIREQFHR
jgi:multidrug resistance efflux pump